MKKEKIHYTEKALTNDIDAITVYLIGCGGTGSHVLSGLAAIHSALVALGHKGLIVTAFDFDTVSESNIGRQMFYQADLGLNKANVLISRINRAFGLQWSSVPESFESAGKTANVIVSCVDSVKARKVINNTIVEEISKSKWLNDHAKPYYWFDCGNSKNIGQVFISTVKPIKQPKSDKYEVVESFPSIMKMFEGQQDIETEPSCSTAQALSRQDLFINKTIATYCCKLLWTMLKDLKTQSRGAYINLENLTTNPIPL